MLDIAFAGGTGKLSFERTTLPLIEGLGERLRAWVDHHDHAEHPRFSTDPRFSLATKAEHGACPEMITPELVARAGAIDTIVCHTDFDGLASAAKWMRAGIEPYPGCDDDARAIDTRTGVASAPAVRMDRALRARPHDAGLFGVITRHLYQGLQDQSLWQSIVEAEAQLAPIEKETRRASGAFTRLQPGVAYVDVSQGYGRLDKTLLLLLGQEREAVSVVVDTQSATFAARFDSGLNFLALFGLEGGMPTRVSLPRGRLRESLLAVGVSADETELLLASSAGDKL